MSGITGNLDCEECLSSAHLANSTELHPHSTVDEDDELLRYIWREYLHPKQYEWVLIVAYIIVFFVSLIGNSLGELKLSLITLLPFVRNQCCKNHAADYTLSNFCFENVNNLKEKKSKSPSDEKNNVKRVQFFSYVAQWNRISPQRRMRDDN